MRLTTKSSNTKNESKSDKLPNLDKTTKSINWRYMQKPWGFSIGNKKKEQIQKLKLKQKQWQDKALLHRLTSIKQRRRHSLSGNGNSTFRPTLHEHVRKEHTRLVKQENEFNRKHMYEQKATIEVKQLEKDWQTKANIRQFISKHGRNKISKSIDMGQIDYNSDSHVVKFNREKTFRETKVHIKVQEYSHVVIVSGQLRESKVCVVMVIEKENIQQILRQDCKGKYQNFVNKLNFDPQINSLYYFTENKIIQQHLISDTCSDFDLRTLRKDIQKQHRLIQLKIKSSGQLQTDVISQKNDQDSVKAVTQKQSAKEL